MSEYINTSEKRLQVLNEIIESVKDNKNVKELFTTYADVLNNLTPFDVFNILHFQEGSNLSTDEIKTMAGKLINIFRHGLENYKWVKKSIFIKKLLEEGNAIKNQFHEIKPSLKDNETYNNKEKLNSLFFKFKELEKRFLKMQYIIYPHLEKHLPNPRPLAVLWSLQDDANSFLKKILKENDQQELKVLIGKFFFIVFGLIEKEELLLLPIASRLIEENEWNEMYEESLSYGFSFLEAISLPKTSKNQKEMNFEGLLFNSTTGGLSLDELLLVFDKIGVDITFVDEFNKVKYFNNPSSRLFPRTPSIIGRDVKKCHPPESVHVVEEIINNFRNNTKDEAKFWIQIKGRFVIISYYAIRDNEGIYKGVLEVSQDVTDIRALEGEKRLLNWNQESK